MIDNFKELLDVQEIDLRIMSLFQEREILPQELEEIKDAVKNEEAKKKELEEENKNLIKERRQRERDLEGKNDTRTKYQTQLYLLKSNKEYTALLKEIENTKNEMDVLEEDVLMRMEKIEDNERKSVEQDKIVEAKRKELEETFKKNAEKIDLIDAKLAEWQKDREEKSSNIPKNILKQYDRVRQARNGTALAQIKNNACQGCFMELPPQVISETKLGQRMVACDNCNRLLYFDNETSID